MPGVERGFLPLAVLGARVAETGGEDVDPRGWADLDPGPYRAWTRPCALLAAGRRVEADLAVAGSGMLAVGLVDDLLGRLDDVAGRDV